MKTRIKKFLKGTPLEPIARKAQNIMRGRRIVEFTTSGDFWENRYKLGGNSGAGSYGRLAEFKAEVLNHFVAQNEVSTIIEFGSGDGHQLSLATYPEYIGIDVSEKAVLDCRQKFSGDASKNFFPLSDYSGQKGDLSLSLDVIYHLVEDEAFEAYMKTLFDAADRFVIVYSSNKNEQPDPRHVRHRKFTDWIDDNRTDFRLDAHIPNRFPFDENDPNNTSFADFYIFEKSG